MSWVLTRITWMLAILFASQALAADRVPTHDELESMRRQALDAYSSGNFEAAESGFLKLISADPRGPFGTYSLGYLKEIVKKDGSVDRAVADFARKKAAGLIPDNPLLSDKYKAFFASLQNPGAIETHLANLVKLGGVLAAKVSFLGIVLDSLGYTTESNFYLEQVEGVVEHVQARAYREQRKNLEQRPLYFHYPKLFKQRGFPILSRGQLEIIPFEKQEGEYSEIKLKRSLEGWHPHLRAGVFVDYESSVVSSPNEAIVTPEQGGGARQTALVNLGIDANLTSPHSYGFDYRLLVSTTPREDVSYLKSSSHLLSAYLSWWDRHEDELKLRYDLALSRFDRRYPVASSLSHGPEISWARLWNQRVRTDFSYSFKFNSDLIDPDRTSDRWSGQAHVFSAQLSYPGKKKSLQPFFKYGFDRSLAAGTHTFYFYHLLEAGTAYLIGESAVANLTTRFGYSGYRTPRTDLLKGFGINVAIPLLEEFLTLTLGGHYDSRTSTDGAFSLSEWTLKSGLVGSLEF